MSICMCKKSPKLNKTKPIVCCCCICEINGTKKKNLHYKTIWKKKNLILFYVSKVTETPMWHWRHCTCGLQTPDLQYPSIYPPIHPSCVIVISPSTSLLGSSALLSVKWLRNRKLMVHLYVLMDFPAPHSQHGDRKRRCGLDGTRAPSTG